ncbi:hypothetical protein [Ideonella sp.]|uniref:hypothetical protein n=1 Tax=Ideonella sp. TaxID=1929293 RepID=UPI0035B345A4
MKPVDSSHQVLIDLVREVGDLKDRAAQQYQPVVNDILRTGCLDASYIVERTLDGLLDFCDQEPMLAMFRALCRHYWSVDVAAAAWYVEAYRELWDGEYGG